MKNKLSIGVDIGGSHVSCMAYDLTKKELIKDSFAESDLDNHAQPKEIIAAWGKAIKKSIDAAGLDNIIGIGFAMPGPFDYVKGIPLFTGENGKYENINGIDVPAMLREFLNLPAEFKIRFINDATAFAIGENQVGKAKDFERSLSVTLGTGFGSAFIKNGLPVVEGDEVPDQGCLWHLPFEDGIADDYFSTRGVINRYSKISGKEFSGVKQIAELAATDESAKNIFDDFGNKMGIFLQPWIKKFGLEAFVIGGNISKAYPLFGESLNKYLLGKGLKLQVFVSELKENASFIGAATLVDDSFYNEVLPTLGKM